MHSRLPICAWFTYRQRWGTLSGLNNRKSAHPRLVSMQGLPFMGAPLREYGTSCRNIHVVHMWYMWYGVYYVCGVYLWCGMCGAIQSGSQTLTQVRVWCPDYTISPRHTPPKAEFEPEAESCASSATTARWAATLALYLHPTSCSASRYGLVQVSFPDGITCHRTTRTGSGPG